MRKRTRQLLFLIFATAFLVSAPVIVLYTAGYRISLNNQRIVETGALAVTTSPKGASIFVDGAADSGRSPTVVQNVFPHDATVRLEKAGYIPWQQTVRVSAGETAYVSAQLFADEEPTMIDNFTDAKDVLQSPNGRYVAALSQTSSGETSVSLYDAVTDYTKPLTTFQSTKKDYALSWLADSSLVLLSEGKFTLEGFTPAGQMVSGSLLTSLTLGAPKAVTFANNGNNVEVRLTESPNGLLALLPTGTYSTLEEDADYLLLRDTRNTLYLISLTSSDVTTLNVPGVLYDWNPDTHVLVWSDGLEVSLYDADKKEKTFLTRQGDPITSLILNPKEHNVILGTATKISAIDIEAYQQGRVTTLLVDEKAGTIERVWFDNAGKNLYFTLTLDQDTALYRRALLQ